MSFWRRREAGAPAPPSQDTRASDLEQVAAAERERIFADLHDDIGAKLLTLIHQLDRPEDADLARAILQDFRDVVSRHQLSACRLQEALGQIREETEQRLQVFDAELNWDVPTDLPDPALHEAQVLNLFRIMREAVTNALRHGHAHRLRIRIRQAGSDLVIDVTDDGPGLANQQAPNGRGSRNMRQRAAALHGQIAWTPGTHSGTKVLLTFPLPPG